MHGAVEVVVEVNVEVGQPTHGAVGGVKTVVGQKSIFEKIVKYYDFNVREIIIALPGVVDVVVDDVRQVSPTQGAVGGVKTVVIIGVVVEVDDDEVGSVGHNSPMQGTVGGVKTVVVVGVDVSSVVESP